MVKLFFSGAENTIYIDILKNRVDNILISYFNLSKKNIKKIVSSFSFFEEIMLDSGAFSLLCSYEKKNTTLGDSAIEKYIDNYITFLKRYGKLIDYPIELDLDDIYGWDKVKKWLNYIEDQSGHDLVEVWHGNRGFKGWKEMVERAKNKKHNMVAIGGVAIKNINKDSTFRIIRKLVNYAYSEKVKVHLMGITDTKIILNYGLCKLYSVDSTTYILGRYGSLPSWSKQRLSKKIKIRGGYNKIPVILGIEIMKKSLEEVSIKCGKNY